MLGQGFRHLNTKSYGRLLPEQHQLLQDVSKAHVESFNYFVDHGIHSLPKGIGPVEFELSNGSRLALEIMSISLQPPMVPSNCTRVRTREVYPVECRERAETYRGRLLVNLQLSVNGVIAVSQDTSPGDIPIMVKSKACHLYGLKPKQLVSRGEEAQEFGGYFIVNGNEKIIRFLIAQRQNYPLALKRPSWKSRGPAYTEYGVNMRCVGADLTTRNVVLHYLTSGTATLAITFNKEQYFLPVLLVLKALMDVTDSYIYKELKSGFEQNSFYKGCITNMLRELGDEGLTQQDDVLRYIGQKFRVRLPVPAWKTDKEVAQFLLKQCVLIHLDKDTDKFHMLILMTKKLFAAVQGQCAIESADNPMFQELTLGGQLIQMVLKEKLETWLFSLKTSLDKDAAKQGDEFKVTESILGKALRTAAQITLPMNYLLATGNLVSKSGIGLMQATGLVTIADKLNFFRYISHFRCVHRGAFFSQMRTTTVRKLLPEAWGFLCPVHTPDGAPCGLLNHMTACCQVVNERSNDSSLVSLLMNYGVTPVGEDNPFPNPYPVLINGKVLGTLSEEKAVGAVAGLRLAKLAGDISWATEICLVVRGTRCAGQFPGLYVFSTMARMVRPVTSLRSNQVEMIGTFEQVYLNIALTRDECIPGVTTHLELCQTAMLSVLANMTPFSDLNQSPRNMYQCQMGKQTMGTPGHSLIKRADNKSYRIQTPQSPLVRVSLYDAYSMDEYPLGTNAVVAVISYTGYDMEDAMVINKSSYERGFGHGSVYKSVFVDLSTKKSGMIGRFFGNVPNSKSSESLDPDGLPPIGVFLQSGDPMYSTVDLSGGDLSVTQYKFSESAYVDQIKVLGNDLGTGQLSKVCFILRVPRNPIIGDKFASRHGQKGICSQLWPAEDMPFTESGICPDIIFNPHGFPSRMTIGLMVESMAGKAAAHNAVCYDATPFNFTEDSPAVEYFGERLVEAGYNYYGTERMYSGTCGVELEANIFIGVVYYQRLRHMVSDKFQVRSQGPIDPVTHQPVKGRKRGGGIRFGEMERDALISHGTSYLLQDRLLNCSDRTLVHVCRGCGSVLTPLLCKPPPDSALASVSNRHQWRCKSCDLDMVEVLSVPYVFLYLCAELAGMNIRLILDLKRTFCEP